MVDHADYRSLLTEAYDLDKPVAPDDEIAIYREAMRTSGEPAFEVMCRSGQLLLPLVIAGPWDLPRRAGSVVSTDVRRVLASETRSASHRGRV